MEEKKEKEKFWITYIKQRIKKNKNFIGFVSGPTGSGKSYSTLRICEEVDPNFNIERCVFSAKELMALINSGKLHRGNAIAFEETGVEISNRNWASVTNKMINCLFQTFRHQGFILIMNSPYMDFIDSHTRKLFHAEMTTQGIDFGNKQVLLKPHLIQYNPRLKKFYYKRLKVRIKKGRVPVSVWKVDKPSQDLVETYETKKKAFTTALNARITQEIEPKTKDINNSPLKAVCNLCNYVWIKRTELNPIVCPKCGSRKWDKPVITQENKAIPLENSGLVKTICQTVT